MIRNKKPSILQKGKNGNSTFWNVASQLGRTIYYTDKMKTI